MWKKLLTEIRETRHGKKCPDEVDFSSFTWDIIAGTLVIVRGEGHLSNLNTRYLSN